MPATYGTSGIDGRSGHQGLQVAADFADRRFRAPALLLLLLKAVIKYPGFMKLPKATHLHRGCIRGLLILTCTGVSFFHGSNDGQKGMGLIMLILIGTVPTAYALNHAVTGQRCSGVHFRV